MKGYYYVTKLKYIKNELKDYFPQLGFWMVCYTASGISYRWTERAKSAWLSLKDSWFDSNLLEYEGNTAFVPTYTTTREERQAYKIMAKTGGVILSENYLIVTMTPGWKIINEYNKGVTKKHYYTIRGYKLPLGKDKLIGFVINMKLNGFKFHEIVL